MDVTRCLVNKMLLMRDVWPIMRNSGAFDLYFYLYPYTYYGNLVNCEKGEFVAIEIDVDNFMLLGYRWVICEKKMRLLRRVYFARVWV